MVRQTGDFISLLAFLESRLKNTAIKQDGGRVTKIDGATTLQYFKFAFTPSVNVLCIQFFFSIQGKKYILYLLLLHYLLHIFIPSFIDSFIWKLKLDSEDERQNQSYSC
jgi:hypothetical protein